jgi:choline-sulfatase
MAGSEEVRGQARPRAERPEARQRRCAGFVVLLACVALLACDRTAERRRLAAAPDVILISVDTLRADATEPYGGPVATPNVGRLARHGTLFERAYATAPSTAPSHASLFSGQSSLHHGVVRNASPLPSGLELLAERYRKVGYATGAFVSSFILDPRFGWDRGFDRFDAHFPAEGASVEAEDFGLPLRKEFAFEGFDRRAEVTTTAALDYLASLPPAPVFLFVHYFDPHAPYVPPARYAERTRTLPVDLQRRKITVRPAAPVTRSIRRYFAEVLYVDAQLGRLLDALEARGRRTLVVFTADHGEGLGQHDHLGHAVNLHEEVLRVPLIFSWLGSDQAPRRIERAVSLVDVAPTVLELSGLPALERSDGTSLARSVRDGAEPGRRPVFASRRRLDNALPRYKPARVAVQDGGWKLIRTRGGPDRLYDVRQDRYELRNRIGDRPEIAAELGEELQQELAAWPAPAPPALSEADRRALEALGYTD